MDRDVLVLAEQKNGELDNIVYELLAKGREVADNGGGTLSVLVIGHDIAPLTEVLAVSGVDRVLVADDAACRDYQPQIYHKIILDVINDLQPGYLFFGYLCLGIGVVLAAMGIQGVLGFLP